MVLPFLATFAGLEFFCFVLEFECSVLLLVS